ncbi:MAG: hypothetical protein Q9178_002355 [Gyalolechia marmorata]
MHLLFAKSFYSLLLFSSALALPLSSPVRQPNLNAALKERGTNWDGTYGEDKRDVHDALTIKDNSQRGASWDNGPVEDKRNTEHSDNPETLDGSEWSRRRSTESDREYSDSPESLDGNEWRRRRSTESDREYSSQTPPPDSNDVWDWKRRRLLTKRNDEEHSDEPQSLNGLEIDWTRKRSTKLSSNMDEKRHIAEPHPPDSNNEVDWNRRRLLTKRNDEERRDKPQSLHGFDIDWQKRNIEPPSKPNPPDSNNDIIWGRKRNIEPPAQPHSPADYDYEWGKRSSTYHPRAWFVPGSSEETTAERRSEAGDKESGWNH